MSGHVRIAELLLESGAKLDANRSGSTPLHAAASGNHVLIAEMLLRRGACVWAKTNAGSTAASVTKAKGHSAVGALLARHETMARSAFFVAAHSGRYDEILATLNAHPPIVHDRDRQDRTALFVCAANGHYQCVCLLLERGSDTEAKTERTGLTPLLVAARLGLHLIIAALLKHGADVQATAAENFTALHLAALAGKQTAINQLVEAGAALEAKTLDGYTALNMAYLHNEIAAAALLLKHGAQTQAPPPLDGQMSADALPRTNKHKKQTQKQTTHIPGKSKTALEMGFPAEQAVKRPTTALHRAAYSNQPTVIKTLLTQKAGVAAVNQVHLLACCHFCGQGSPPTRPDRHTFPRSLA